VVPKQDLQNEKSPDHEYAKRQERMFRIVANSKSSYGVRMMDFHSFLGEYYGAQTLASYEALYNEIKSASPEELEAQTSETTGVLGSKFPNWENKFIALLPSSLISLSEQKYIFNKYFLESLGGLETEINENPTAQEIFESHGDKEVTIYDSGVAITGKIIGVHAPSNSVMLQVGNKKKGFPVEKFKSLTTYVKPVVQSFSSINFLMYAMTENNLQNPSALAKFNAEGNADKNGGYALIGNLLRDSAYKNAPAANELRKIIQSKGAVDVYTSLDDAHEGPQTKGFSVNESTIMDSVPASTVTEAKVPTAPAPVSTDAKADIEKERATITASEFTELKRLEKLFLENPKEPTVSGSVVTKYPALFKAITDIERRRQEELNARDKQSGELLKEAAPSQYVLELRKAINAFIDAAKGLDIFKDVNKIGDKLLSNDSWRELWLNLGGDFQELLWEGKIQKAFDKAGQTYEEQINAKYDAELAALESSVISENTKKEGTNKRGSTYTSETEEKEGIKTTKYIETNKQGKKITLGGRVMAPKDFIAEYSVTNEDDLDNLEGATEIVVQEVRTSKEGKQGITIRVSFGQERMKMEVRGLESSAPQVTETPSEVAEAAPVVIPPTVHTTRSEHAQKVVQKLIADSAAIPDPSEGVYFINGEYYMRQSEYNFGESKGSQNAQNGATVGDYLDALGRDVLGGKEIKSREEYLAEVEAKQGRGGKNKLYIPLQVSEEQHNQAVLSFQIFKKSIEAAGGKLYTDKIVLYRKFVTPREKKGKTLVGVAGVIDIFIIDKDGMGHIVDMKNFRTKAISGEQINLENAKNEIVFGFRDEPSREAKWQKQQTTYDVLGEGLLPEIGSINILLYGSQYFERTEGEPPTEKLILGTLQPITFGDKRNPKVPQVMKLRTSQEQKNKLRSDFIAREPIKFEVPTTEVKSPEDNIPCP
jgi:hypothetical protein